jgi:MFS transporter, DHA2 family, multidrug resistance protein
LISGALLTHFDRGSVFVITLPLAVVALVMAIAFVPSHVNETTDPVDNLSGIFSMVLVGALVLAINFAAVPNDGALAIGLGAIALAAAIVFLIRQRQAESPLYDLRIARRRIFWVAACAGLVVFGTLMAAMFVGQQFLQNVLGYSMLQAGQTMLLLWKEDIAYWKVGLGYALIGAGVGFAGTPASHSLTGSVPVSRAGMASGTADLQRDLGGAIMQSILGALLTAGYAAAVATAIAADPNKEQITDSVQAQLQKSIAGAEEIAEQYPQYAGAITAGAKTSFLDGADWAYTAGIVAILLGATLVFVLFPKKDEEEALLDEYRAEDVKITSPG